MKNLLVLLLIAFAVTSCKMSDDGEISTTPLFWIIIIGIIVLFVIAAVSGSKQANETKETLSRRGLKIEDFKFIGSYVGGHPLVNNNIDRVVFRSEGEDVLFYNQPTGIQLPSEVFRIKKNSITVIDVEDSSSIEKKITLGRVLLVGVFALAWRKKKKNELAFVVVSWNDGRFDHATTFSFTGTNAMVIANTARNQLIQSCS
jgi:hypothetical protein